MRLAEDKGLLSTERAYEGRSLKISPDLFPVKAGSGICTRTLPYTSIGHMVICSSDT